MNEVDYVRLELVSLLKRLDDLDEKLAAIHINNAIDVLGTKIGSSGTGRPTADAGSDHAPEDD